MVRDPAISTMKRALILYNPASGQRHQEREMRVEKAVQVLRASGVEAEATPTLSASSAPDQVRKAIAAGFDTVIAGGGDGTINDILQGVVGTSLIFGVLPLGTANALANDLGLPRDSEACARQLLEYQPRRVPAGVIRTGDSGDLTRYFTVMAGVGADARLIYVMSAELKQRWGLLAYFIHGGAEYLRYHYAPFQAEIRIGNDTRVSTVTQVLAVRLENLGFPLRRLAHGAHIGNTRLRVMLFHRAIRITYGVLLSLAVVGLRTSVPGIEVLDADEVRCTPLPGAAPDRRIYAETDGELAGTMPASLAIERDAFTLLMPPSS